MFGFSYAANSRMCRTRRKRKFSRPITGRNKQYYKYFRKLLFTLQRTSFQHTINAKNYFQSWTNTLNDAITLYGLGRAFHVVNGSHILNKSPAGLLSIIIVITHSLLTCACSILAIVCINKIAHYTNTDSDNLSQISWGTQNNIYFYVLPQGLGFMGILFGV